MLVNKTVTVDADGRPRDWLGNHASHTIGGEYKDQPDKGEPGGSCNIGSCQRPNAVFKNTNNGGKYYCRECAHRLNRANTGDPIWEDILLDREVLGKHDAALKAA